MKYSIIFVLFVTLFFVACTSTQSNYINISLESPSLIGDLNAPQINQNTGNDDADTKQDTDNIDVQDNEEPVFVNNLQFTNFELTHSDFEDTFFSNNKFLINNIEFVLYNDILNQNLTSDLCLINNCQTISDNSKICSNCLVEEKLNVFVKNYDNVIKLDANIKIISQCSLPTLCMEKTLTLELIESDIDKYFASFQIPYIVNDVLLGNFTLSFTFIVV